MTSRTHPKVKHVDPNNPTGPLVDERPDLSRREKPIRRTNHRTKPKPSKPPQGTDSPETT